jgi:transcriptional regulator of acetoin/glycerol metabolism
VQFAIVHCNGTLIGMDDLPMELRDITCQPIRRGPGKKLDIENVREALAETGGNKAKAARLLGVGRATLYRFLGDYPDLS